MEYRYHLLKYSGPASRYTCPSCGRPHCFTPYVDENDTPADIKRYGRCDHASSCGYICYPPSEKMVSTPLSSHSMKTSRTQNKARFEPSKPKVEQCVIPDDIVRRTAVFTPKNRFLSFLLTVLPEDKVRTVADDYRIGVTRDGSTVFYQIDSSGACHAGKIISYDAQTGHRIKDAGRPDVSWAHTELMKSGALPSDWVLSQCLFGEHLLARRPDAVVGLVESEKTAVICAALAPEYVWLATGGKQQFGDNLLALSGRRVVVFPDVDAFDDWTEKARHYPLLDLHVSDWLERFCTPEQRALKVDIADLLLEALKHPLAYQFKTPLMAQLADRIPSEYWPEMDELIEELGLEVVNVNQSVWRK